MRADVKYLGSVDAQANGSENESEKVIYIKKFWFLFVVVFIVSLNCLYAFKKYEALWIHHTTPLHTIHHTESN